MTMEHEDPRPEPATADMPAMEELLGGDPGPAASTQNLEGVMRRHLRHRRRWTTGVAAAVVAFGTGGGVLAAELVSSSPAIVGAAGQHPQTPAANNALGEAPAGSVGTPISAFSAPANLSAPQGLVWASGGATNGAAGSVTGSLGASSTAPGSGGGSATSTPGPVVPGVCMVTGCFDSVLGGTHVTRLFDRTANGVDVRVFEVTYSYFKYMPEGATVPPNQATSPPAQSPGGAPASAPTGSGSGTASSGTATGSGTSTGGAGSGSPTVMPACAMPKELVVEVSDAQAVGEFMVPLPGSAPKSIALASEDVVGVAEGSPMAVVAVKAGTGVHAVSATFASGAHDSMTVVGGVAVLVAPVKASPSPYSNAAASLVATGGTGRVVERFQLPGTPSLAEPRACLPVSPVVPGGPAVGVKGGAGSSGGSAGSPGTVSGGSSTSSSSR